MTDDKTEDEPSLTLEVKVYGDTVDELVMGLQGVIEGVKTGCVTGGDGDSYYFRRKGEPREPSFEDEDAEAA